jgi:uncharacterized membrane protein
MKTKKKLLLRLFVITMCCIPLQEMMAQNANNNATAAGSGTTAWIIVGIVAVILMIMNLKHTIKNIAKYLSINLFTKKALNYEKN